MAEAPSAEQLLQDIAWLKGLATVLASDRDDADDLVQEARIAAWQRQPDATRPMRGWLTKVVRDLAGMQRRSDRRRAARHALVDNTQVAAGSDELLERLRLHRLLVELVIQLAEPYRSTIIARFVEGRTSASIAKSLGIPAGTVRKRLHEALARLRAGLDDSAGDRKHWAPAVLAYASGGIHVAKPTKLGIVVIPPQLAATAVTLLIAVPMHNDNKSAEHSAPTTSSGAAPVAPTVTDAAATARPPHGPLSERRAAEREEMLAAIARARKARDHHIAAADPTGSAKAKARASAATPSGANGTTLDIIDNTGDTSEWQMRALGTLNNLLGQCYDLGRAEDPDLEGTITIRFRLVGEPGVGGLLERVEIVDPDTTITQQTIRTCFAEQLYALELDPPPDGVTVERELHLQFPIAP